MAPTKHLPESYGYSCNGCKYDSDRYYSDIFGECPCCDHDPHASNIDEVRDMQEPCEFFDYEVYIPKYKYVVKRDVYGRN